MAALLLAVLSNAENVGCDAAQDHAEGRSLSTFANVGRCYYNVATGLVTPIRLGDFCNFTTESKLELIATGATAKIGSWRARVVTRFYENY